MKVFIVEDELPALALYKEYLRQDMPEVEIVGEAVNMRQAREFFLHNQPDLALLDIKMEEEETTTFALLEELQEADRINFDIIFVTAHGIQEFMLQALELSALKYITKPVNRQEFKKAIEKAIARKADRDTLAQQIKTLLESTRPAAKPPECIPVPTLKGIIEMVCLNDIIYINSYQKATMTQLFLSSQTTTLKSTRTIGAFRDLLTGPAGFFQIHESILINLNKMRRFDPGEKAVTMSNGTVLFAAKRGAKALRQYLSNDADAPLEGENLPVHQRIWRMLRGGNK
jgi:DNA-binding LytR/AlgR family response regulator